MGGGGCEVYNSIQQGHDAMSKLNIGGYAVIGTYKTPIWTPCEGESFDNQPQTIAVGDIFWKIDAATGKL
jgi:hypothetical protein